MSKWISAEYLLGKMSLRKDGVLTRNDVELAPYAEFKWIPVTERLPDCFGVFIVAIHEPFAEGLGTDSADFDPFTKEWLPSMCWDKGYKVTHWMPLPEPPTEE